MSLRRASEGPFSQVAAYLCGAKTLIRSTRMTVAVRLCTELIFPLYKFADRICICLGSALFADKIFQFDTFSKRSFQTKIRLPRCYITLGLLSYVLRLYNRACRLLYIVRCQTEQMYPSVVFYTYIWWVANIVTEQMFPSVVFLYLHLVGSQYRYRANVFFSCFSILTFGGMPLPLHSIYFLKGSFLYLRRFPISLQSKCFLLLFFYA